MSGDSEQNEIAVGMELCGIAGLFITLFIVCSSGRLSVVWIIISILYIMMELLMMSETENSNNQASHKSNINVFQDEYDEYAYRMGIVKSDTQGTLIESDEDEGIP